MFVEFRFYVLTEFWGFRQDHWGQILITYLLLEVFLKYISIRFIAQDVAPFRIQSYIMHPRVNKLNLKNNNKLNQVLFLGFPFSQNSGSQLAAYTNHQRGVKKILISGSHPQRFWFNWSDDSNQLNQNLGLRNHFSRKKAFGEISSVSFLAVVPLNLDNSEKYSWIGVTRE